MRPLNRVSAVVAFAASAMLASPAAALELPRPHPGAYDAAAENVQHRRWHRNNGIDAGDVIAGVLVLGGIAAIASAASRSRDRVERYPTRYPYPEDPRYRDTPRTYEGRGMDRAVDMCVDEVERDRRDRIASVDSANRTGDGWFISGELEGGAPFTCRIGNDGRISDIETGDAAYGSGLPNDAYAGASAEEQYADDVYYRAREGQRAWDGEEPYTYAR